MIDVGGGYVYSARRRLASMKTLDLTQPQDAREYVSRFRIEGHEIQVVETKDGKFIELANMTDQEAVEAAETLYGLDCDVMLEEARQYGRIH